MLRYLIIEYFSVARKQEKYGGAFLKWKKFDGTENVIVVRCWSWKLIGFNFHDCLMAATTIEQKLESFIPNIVILS